MNEKEITSFTDLTRLRLKRGVRKRNIGKIKAYLQTVTDFPFTQLKKSELKRQLETLEHQSAIYELIQDRIVELLEEKDSGGHLEEEEQEAVEQGQFHRELQERLEALLNSVEVHVKTHDLKNQLRELEEVESQGNCNQ